MKLNIIYCTCMLQIMYKLTIVQVACINSVKKFIHKVLSIHSTGKSFEKLLPFSYGIVSFFIYPTRNAPLLQDSISVINPLRKASILVGYDQAYLLVRARLTGQNLSDGSHPNKIPTCHRIWVCIWILTSVRPSHTCAKIIIKAQESKRRI